jgi:hypothetical protein
MRNRLAILAAPLVVGLLGLGRYLYRGERVPSGQPALVTLSAANFDLLRSSFNAASGDVRIVLLLSPT